MLRPCRHTKKGQLCLYFTVFVFALMMIWGIFSWMQAELRVANLGETRQKQTEELYRVRLSYGEFIIIQFSLLQKNIMNLWELQADLWSSDHSSEKVEEVRFTKIQDGWQLLVRVVFWSDWKRKGTSKGNGKLWVPDGGGFLGSPPNNCWELENVTIFSWQICVMLCCEYGPKSLRNVSNNLLNLCY